MEKWNSQCEHREPIVQTSSLFSTCKSGWLAVDHNISVTSGEYNGLHGQVRLAVVNHIYVFPRGYDRLQRPKD